MSDIDTVVVVDSLKALDPKRPIREADISRSVRLRLMMRMMNGIALVVLLIKHPPNNWHANRPQSLLHRQFSALGL